MGKRLIIRGADFSDNCIEIGDTIAMKKSGAGVNYLNYQTTVNSIQRNRVTAAQTSKLFVFDVNNFVGRTVQITACHAVVSGASYCCFSSDLGTLSFVDIPNLVGSQATSDMPLNVQITVVENFNVSVTTKVKNTITKVIPTGANYLLLSYKTDGDLAENAVKVELVEESSE